MFGWKRRALAAERKKQAAYDDYCEVVKERDRLDSAIGWWQEWHDTLRRALGLMYCETSVTLAVAKRLIRAHRAQAAIAAIDQAHLRYERQHLTEHLCNLVSMANIKAMNAKIQAEKAEAEIERLRDTATERRKMAEERADELYEAGAAAAERADKAEAELARVVAQRERLLEAVEICHATADGICEEPGEERKPAPELVRCEAWKECADETCRWKEPHKPNYGCTLEHVCSGRGSCKCIPVQEET